MFAPETPIAFQRRADGPRVQDADVVLSLAPRHHRVVAPLPLPVVDDVIVVDGDGVAEACHETS